jgi:tetratricopeptide (TPR) repeat protein
MPSTSDALRIAIDHQQAGRLREAEQICREILAAEPSCTEAWHLLGGIAYQVGRHAIAAQCLERALALKPNFAEAWSDYGSALKDQKKLEEAITAYRRALALRPEYAAAHNNLAMALEDQGRTDEAIASYRRALALQPLLAEAHSNLGGALQQQGQIDEAIECYRRALGLKPAFAEACVNLGHALKLQRRLAEALVQYDRAIELRPSYAAARVARAKLRLLCGDLAGGWPEFEWRWKTERLAPAAQAAPQWDGQNLGGGDILLHCEQGFGDAFQFVRYAPLVKARGGRVILGCYGPILKIMSRCPGVDELRGLEDSRFEVSAHAPLMSLPRIVGTSLETIPADVPYLFADEGLVAAWAERLSGLTGTRIGINWQGRSDPGTDRSRDIPLACFLRLSRLPTIRLVSLQKGVGRNELAAVGEPSSILDPGDDVDTAHGAFMDTAAIMMNLDLVITSDTSIAHLAGALGVPVWVALPFMPEWRWLLDRSDSPWYPTMRLFRQKSPGDWVGVFEELAAALPCVRSRVARRGPA